MCALGVAGLSPFILLAATLIFFDDIPARPIQFALLSYGATILSFLGGTQWVLAAASTKHITREKSVFWGFFVSVIPSLVGWASLLVPIDFGYFILVASFAAILWLDVRATQGSLLPEWYLRLRIALTLIVVPCLVIGGVS